MRISLRGPSNRWMLLRGRTGGDWMVDSSAIILDQEYNVRQINCYINQRFLITVANKTLPCHLPSSPSIPLGQTRALSHKSFRSLTPPISADAPPSYSPPHDFLMPEIPLPQAVRNIPKVMQKFGVIFVIFVGPLLYCSEGGCVGETTPWFGVGVGACPEAGVVFVWICWPVLGLRWPFQNYLRIRLGSMPMFVALG